MRNSQKADPEPGANLTRRRFIGEIAAASAVLSALPVIGHARLAGDSEAERTPARAGVVAFHLDQPYWDASGAALPYVPAQGMRSAAPLAHLSQAELLGMQGYL